MSLAGEIRYAAEMAAREAEQAARDTWRKTPELANTASLVGSCTRIGSDTAQIDIRFETHRQKIPIQTRDMYGVAQGSHTAQHADMHEPRTDPETLMQKTGEAMERAFTDSFLSRIGSV